MKEYKRIVFVDDDPNHLLIGKLVLERRGYEVLTLNNCEDLITRILDFNADLIFMDHNMPEISGIDATQLLKAEPRTREITVIYFSGEKNIEKLAAEAGADGWLSKPFQIEEMVMTVKRYSELG
ncbi:MAG TPA: response regulator [Puia sp.]|jgi:two-component system cell cycle response regulator DivK|nr:response regulator [Puia sp.]